MVYEMKEIEKQDKEKVVNLQNKLSELAKFSEKSLKENQPNFLNHGQVSLSQSFDSESFIKSKQTS